MSVIGTPPSSPPPANEPDKKAAQSQSPLPKPVTLVVKHLSEHYDQTEFASESDESSLNYGYVKAGSPSSRDSQISKLSSSALSLEEQGYNIYYSPEDGSIKSQEVSRAISPPLAKAKDPKHEFEAKHIGEIFPAVRAASPTPVPVNPHAGMKLNLKVVEESDKRLLHQVDTRGVVLAQINKENMILTKEGRKFKVSAVLGRGMSKTALKVKSVKFSLDADSDEEEMTFLVETDLLKSEEGDAGSQDGGGHQGQSQQEKDAKAEAENEINLHKFLQPSHKRGLMSNVAVAGILPFAAGKSCLVTEFGTEGSVNDILKVEWNTQFEAKAKSAEMDQDSKTINERKLRMYNIALGMCEGVRQIHEMGVIHRDLKPDNFVVSKKNNKEKVLLIDLSKGSFIHHAGPKPFISTTYPVTYTPPEFLLGVGTEGGMENFRRELMEALTAEELNKVKADAFSPKSDVFMLGITLYQVFAGVPMEKLTFKAPNVKQYKAVQDYWRFFFTSGKNTRTDTSNEVLWGGFQHLDADMQALIKRMIDIDPAKRPTAKEAAEIIKRKIAEIEKSDEDPFTLDFRADPPNS